MTNRIRLGTVIAPSGVLVVTDAHCAALWTQAGEDYGRRDVERQSGEFERPAVRPAVCWNIPGDRELDVFAELITAGADETWWRRIYVEIEPGREIAYSEKIGEAGGSRARLMFVDSDALSEWQAGGSLDGLADCGSANLGPARVCSFVTSLAPSSLEDAFDVLAERDAKGALVRLVVDCGDEQGRFGDLSTCAIVTKSIVEEGKDVVCLFREEPVGETDSGWVVTAGESPDYFDVAENVQLVRLRELLQRHPELGPLFLSPPGSAFKRDGEGGAFVAAQFPDPLDKNA
jgi:hypothetical protein